MRCHDAKHGVSVQDGAHVGLPAERAEDGSHEQGQPVFIGSAPPPHLYPSISTERIMHAVERQRRITAQLDDLRAQQRQHAAILRTAGLKILAWGSLVLGVLIGSLVFLFALQPLTLARALGLFSGFIALLLALGESLQASLSLIPAHSWLLSAAALAVVLMMALWLYLMRYPREV